ncbi:hypothetical protein KNP414_04879 [Paenibacillus mucilaginosus KNP414]|uniref:Uncharacterized protein n=1 Tax=Paenibacillus mucilaginosus (strain KNP414) TaxID=1036673 RepID=F8FJS4_PAEMK|nr:hypothetical protein KNP414_04879 [Paenibacillus mucilaginosus KNP414]
MLHESFRSHGRAPFHAIDSVSTRHPRGDARLHSQFPEVTLYLIFLASCDVVRF